MDEDADAVAAHYGRDGLVQRLLDDAQARHGAFDRVTPAHLRPMDQLHGGGFAATEAMAGLAGVAPGERVLDAGSGLGGTSRYLAQAFGVEVEAIDLTPDFVGAAQDLNRRCGFGHLIRTSLGSVTALPFAHGSFDLVWSQFVAMNVADKPALLREAFRVLRPGGRIVLAMLAQGPEGPPHYPLPWARDPAHSHLWTPDALLAGLADAGFAVEATRSPPPGQRPAEGPPKIASMGDDMAQREDNAARSVAEGRLRPITVLARRPTGEAD